MDSEECGDLLYELGNIALRNGLKLLSCGITKEPSAFRALFLSDVLTKEIDDFARACFKIISYWSF